MQNPSAEKRPLRALWALAVLVVALVGPACSSEGDGLPPLDDGSSSHAPGLKPCVDGGERACGVKLSQENGVVTCLQGTQRCEDGAWSECEGEDVTRRPDPSAKKFGGFFQSKLQPQAFLPPESAPAPCEDDPCDPNCYYYDEDPDDITPSTGSTGTPSWPGGPGVTACDHDLCDAGDALYAPCHGCVTKICNQMPSCCTTAWTSSCVELTYSLCNQTRAPRVLCDFGLFSNTTISVANRSTADAVIGAYGNVSISTDGSVKGVLTKGNVDFASLNGATVDAPSGIIADGNVTSQDSNSTIKSFIEAGGSVFIPSWDVQQYVHAGTSLTGQNSTTILGNAKANSGISNVSSVSGSSCSTSGCYTHKPVVLPPQTAGNAIPTLPTDCTGTTNFTANGTTVTVNGPGTYGDVSVINNGRIVLQGEGVYYFKNFSVTNRIELQRTATNTGQGWDIRTCGSTVSFGNGTQIVGSTAGGVTPALVLDSTNSVVMDPTMLTFYASTSNNITMGTDVYFTGVFIAPNAAVTKANMNSYPTKAQVNAGTRSAPINGAIWAKQLTAGTDALTKQISREACESLDIPGTADDGAACPITNVTPDVPAAIVEPCASGLDCQMNQRCTGPQTSASCAHSKCMPGAALSATCDSCVERICAVDSTCCTTSWSPSCVAKVATVCDATCQPYSCYAPDLCAAQTDPVAATCNSCVASICAIPGNENCCTGTWSQACADQVYTVCSGGLPTAPTSGTSICDYSAYAVGAMALMGNNVGQYAKIKGGSVGGNGLGSLNLSFTDIQGNVYNAGSLYTYYTTVSGNLIYGSGSNAINAPTSYTSLINANPPQPARPTRSFTCSGGSTPTSGTISPGHFGNVSVPNGQTLTLQAGTYYFSSLTIGAGGATSTSYGTLELPASGRVTINVCGAVTFNNYARMTGITQSTAANLDIYATGAIQVNQNNTVYGILNSNSSVSVSSNSTLYGFGWSGGTMSVLGNNATVDSTSLSDSCKANYDTNASARRLDRLCGYAAYGKTGFVTSNGTAISGGDSGSGSTFTAGDTSRFYTNVLAEGNVAKGSTSVYSQSLRSRGTITGTALVAGTQTASASSTAVPTPTWPTVSFSCTSGKPPGGVDQNLWGGTLVPGTYGNVTLAGGSQNLTLQSGDYYVGNFTLTQSSSTLTLPTTGQVRIFACGKVSFTNGLTLANAGSGATTDKLRVYSLSTNTSNTDPAIYINNGSGKSMTGVFIAPNGKIAVGPSSTLNGAGWGDAFFTGTSATVSGANFSGATCEAASVDASPSCPVTVTTGVPAEPATCDANNVGYTDPTCSTYDLAADVPCDDQVPICNHGTATYTGDLTIGYWSADKGQMSLAPASKVPDGTCSATGLSIAPGNCVEVTCAMPSGGTHSLLIDPDVTLSECGAGSYNRRLDNWTVHDGRSCSSGGNEVEYLYEADCSGEIGTAPLWGFLHWNTTTPSGSYVRFSAEVGSDATTIGGSYQQIGLAEPSPVDTSECSKGGPSGCPVPISDELGLSRNQGKYLALKIELDGTAAPTLRDWLVTYTCVYDE